MASWTFSGLTPGATYQVAATWQAFWYNTFYARYKLYDDGTLVSVRELSQYYAPGDFTDGGVGWEVLGYFEATGNTLDVRLSNASSGRLMADAVRIEEIKGDGGLDDDFHLSATSPGVPK